MEYTRPVMPFIVHVITGYMANKTTLFVVVIVARVLYLLLSFVVVA